MLILAPEEDVAVAVATNVAAAERADRLAMRLVTGAADPRPGCR